MIGSHIKFQKLALSTGVIATLLWGSHRFIYGYLDIISVRGVHRADTNLVLEIGLIAAVSFIFVWSYSAWARRGGMLGGLQHGVFYGVLAGVLVQGWQYWAFPLPLGSVAISFGVGMVQFCISGAIVAWLYPLPCDH
ncbi:MAG: hypothetical protein OQK24_12085 [Magnetovibrio sp.]|nr:hypothetical protein [Magnetovibrio sp.]